jgi:hypothetical protein
VTAGKRRLIVATVVIVLASAAAGASLVLAGPSSRSIPIDAWTKAVTGFQGEYGKVEAIYAEAATTLAEWKTSEPNNGLSLAGLKGGETQPIYAMFVTGSFAVIGPAPHPARLSDAGFDQGRLVFDETGEVLNVILWRAADKGPPFTTGEPAFGGAFDH